ALAKDGSRALADETANESVGRQEAVARSRSQVGCLNPADEERAITARRVSAVRAGAELQTSARLHFEDHRLDVDLSLWHIELVDHVAQCQEIATRRHDEQFVRRPVSDHL